MRSSKSLDEYFPMTDGHPVDNFEDKPSPWLALHDSKFAKEQPWLTRFEVNDFYALASRTVWAELSCPGKRTSFDAIAKQVALKSMELVVSGYAGSDGRSVRALLVDEVQDLNACQIEYLVRMALICGILSVFVGDSMQSIYGFRGATGEHFTRLAGGLLPSNSRVDVRLFPLTTCYRCPCLHVAAANLMLVARARSEQSDRFVHFVLQPAPGAPDGELLQGTLLDDLPTPFGLVVFLARSRLVLLEQAFELLSRPVPPVLSLGSEENWHIELDRCRALYGGWVASQARPNALLVFSFAPFATMPAMAWDDRVWSKEKSGRVKGKWSG
jgi:hypothetical protein